MNKVYCGKKFSIYHNDYAICNEKHQCYQCSNLEKILNDPIVSKLKNCANCHYIEELNDYDATDYICNNIKNGFTYVEPGDKCDNWEYKNVT